MDFLEIQKFIKEDPLVVIIDEQKQFCQNAENWKVLVQRATIKYKKLVDKENEKDQKKGRKRNEK